MKNRFGYRFVLFVLVFLCGISINIQGVSAAKKTYLTKKTSVYYHSKKTIRLKNNQKKVQWKVKNKKIAKIVKKSKKSVSIKGLKAGKTVVTAKIGKKKYFCTVRVKFKNNKQRVGSYRYKITPLLAPFDEYFYVETNNPNVDDIRFVDPSSKYYSGKTKGYVTPVEQRYYDVVYQKKKTGRVKGGYIFTAEDQQIDGGKLVLQVLSKNGEKYQNTSVKVTCKPVKNVSQYLVDTCTNSSMGFFDKMDAIQKKMESISIYPRRFLDGKKNNPYTPYPFLTSSPYPELDLNVFYRMKAYMTDSLFASDLYPFVLDSLSFPDTLRKSAKIISSSCSVRQGENHYEIRVIYNGKTKVYGGDGNGESNPIYSTDVQRNYRFNRSSGDVSRTVTLSSLKNTLEKYGAAADRHILSYKSSMEGKEFTTKIGKGAWLRVGIEPFYRTQPLETCYTYVSHDPVSDSPFPIEDVWVDGRYINKNNQFIQGEKYENRPDAMIVVKNQSYKTIQGTEKKGDLYFIYMDDDEWYAIYNYLDGDSSLISKSLVIPSQFKLTRSQVKNMKVDQNTNKIPEKGLIYDGSVKPGTAFKH